MKLIFSARKQSVSLLFRHQALFIFMILPGPSNPVTRNVEPMRLREVKGGPSHPRDGVRPESSDGDDGRNPYA